MTDKNIIVQFEGLTGEIEFYFVDVDMELENFIKEEPSYKGIDKDNFIREILLEQYATNNSLEFIVDVEEFFTKLKTFENSEVFK
jgi:hypothetical protein